MDIPTGIPESVIDRLNQVLNSGAIDIVWKAMVIAVVLWLAWLLARMGFFGGVLAFIFLGSLISDDIRTIVSDVWHRNFWVWSV